LKVKTDSRRKKEGDPGRVMMTKSKNTQNTHQLRRRSPLVPTGSYLSELEGEGNLERGEDKAGPKESLIGGSQLFRYQTTSRHFHGRKKKGRQKGRKKRSKGVPD